MPKIITLNQFASKGINSDLMPWDLSGDYLTEVKNIRINRGKLSPYGGHSEFATLPVDFMPGYIMPAGSISDQYWIIAGKDAVYSFDGENFNDISSQVYAVPNEDDWTGCLLSNVAVITNPGHFPEYWNSSTPLTPLTALPWDTGNTWEDVNERAGIIRSHKQFLFALDIESGGVAIEDGVRWSAPADVNGVPSSWDPTDVTNVAGIVNLGGDGGKIVDGLSLRDSFVVYRESGISVFDFVGGQFVWQVRHLSDTIGLISPDALIEVKGRHYLIGDGDILVNDGNSITSLLHNRLRTRFTSNFDAENYHKAYAVRNNLASEVWFCVPEVGFEYPNIAYIYNWRNDSWSIRDIPQGPFGNYGPQSSPAITWESSNLTWEEGLAAWDQQQATPLDDTIMIITKPEGAGESGKIFIPEYSAQNPSTSFSSIIERTGFALEGLGNVTTITRLYPRSRGPGSFYVEIGSQDYPGAPIRWKDRVLFNPNDGRKVDIRSTGELHCFKFTTTDDNLYWELSGIDIEYVNAGLR